MPGSLVATEHASSHDPMVSRPCPVCCTESVSGPPLKHFARFICVLCRANRGARRRRGGACARQPGSSVGCKQP